MAQSELQNGATSNANIVITAMLAVRPLSFVGINFIPTEFSSYALAAPASTSTHLLVSMAMPLWISFDHNFAREGPVDKYGVSRGKGHADDPPDQANL